MKDLTKKEIEDIVKESNKDLVGEQYTYIANDEVDARKERLYIEKEYNKKFRIYNCSDCNGWHFSTIN